MVAEERFAHSVPNLPQGYEKALISPKNKLFTQFIVVFVPAQTLTFSYPTDFSWLPSLL